MNESGPVQPEATGEPKPRGSINKVKSEEDLSATPARLGSKGAKTYQIDQEALNRYKYILQKRVAWAFILLFVVIIERIFVGYTRDMEEALLISLQTALGITYDQIVWYLQPVVFLEKYLYFALLLTHFFVIIYYFYNAVICLKIMYIHLNAMAFMSILEIIFSDPRPYWSNDQIVAAGCSTSYGFPSFTVFCLLFLFMYSWHCFQEDEEERTWNKVDIFKSAVFCLVFGTFCFLKFAGGFEYITQILLTLLYSVLVYYLAIFFDKTITNLVEKSSIDIQAAKRYSIFWMVYILLVVGLTTITVQSSEETLEIAWFGNYFNCLDKYQQTDVLKETPYYHLIGSWGSYLKTYVLFMLLGGVFGAAKAFRDFKGVLWYATSNKNKAKMAAVASLCILPSWLITYFQSDFIIYLQQGGIDTYLFNAFHFTLLYFMLFGMLPGYVFDHWGLLNKESGYYFAADEIVRIES